MLEDFVKKLIKKDDTLVGFAEETVAKLPDVRFKKSYTTKAVLHTWLAWQEQPNSDIWRGVENKYFDTEITICKEFIQWLKTLYNL